MIFYFSSTGNTRWVATRLAASLSEHLVAIADVLQGDCEFKLQENERIGFCFPVYGWRVPKIVDDFVKKIRVGAGKHYCFVVVTAGDNVGLTIQQAEKMLTSKGITMDSAFSVIMPESYVGLRMLKLDTPEKARQKVRNANKFLEKIEDVVLDRRGGQYNIVEGNWPRINSKILGAAFQKWLVTDKPFRVDAQKCIGCGLCEKKCPVGNIRMNADNHPEWLHTGRCMTCFSCYHHCPERAIDYGSSTKGVGQYRFNEAMTGEKHG